MNTRKPAQHTILAISLTDAGMAVGLRRQRAGETVSDYGTDPHADQHSDRLLGLIDELITGCGLSAEALTGIAFDAGPGGFTRVRIACAVAQGIAMGLRIPVAPIDSLQAIALASARESGARQIAVCVDARMGQCYVGRYRHDGTRRLNSIEPAMTMHTDAVSTWLASHQSETDPLQVAGNAFDRFEQIRPLDQPAPAAAPSAAAITAAVLDLAQQTGNWASADQAAPLYVRDKVALNIQEQAALREKKRPESSA